MPMKLEAWPGGRWYRDLGDGNGHYWGTVQAIKRPTLLEFCGPLFASVPAAFQRAVSAERSERRNADRVSPQALGFIARKTEKAWEKVGRT